MPPSGDDFFYQATLRICSSLDLKTMLSNCGAYIRHAIPADGLCMNIYDVAAKTLEDVAYSTELAFEPGEPIIRLSPEAIDYIEDLEKKDPLHPDFIVNSPQEDPIGKLFWQAIGSPRMCYMFSLLKVGSQKIGVISLWAKGHNRYTSHHLEMLNLLNGPFAISLSNALRYRDVLQLKEQLIDDNHYLNRQLHHLTGDEIIGRNFGLRDVMVKVKQY